MMLLIVFRRTSLAAILALLLFVPLVGCEKAGGDHVTVVGKVTLDGAPVAEGTIRFEPMDGNGQPVEVPLKDGNYTVELTPGEKKVLLQGYKQGPPDPSGARPNVPILPAAYNEKSTISRIVTKEGTKSFDFDLKSSGELPGP